jgi:hypothetical protein
MLCVGMPFWTLCVLFMARSVAKCISTLERGNEIESTGYRADAPRRHAVLDALRPLYDA